MAIGQPEITVIGNLTDDVQLDFTASNLARARFTVASTPRAFNKATGAWDDGTTLFLRCTAWRQLAEHAAETLTRGMRVIATGRLQQFDWETDEGERRSMLSLNVDEVGPGLQFATAKVTKAVRSAANTAPGPVGTKAAAPAGPAGGDAWSTTRGEYDAPPF